MNRANIENIRVAFVAIKSQVLRSILTAMIIAIGITALVGILTAIDARYYLNVDGAFFTRSNVV